MKIFFTLSVLLFVLPSQGQDFVFPAFKKSGKSFNDFIDPGWFLKDSTTGDLNNDGVADLVIVAELKDTIKEARPDNSINTGSPRILMILFKDRQKGRYDLILQHNTFILRHGEGGMDPEAYDKIIISGNILEILFEFIRGYSSYRFSYQKDDFYLIGATTSNVHQGQFEYLDINFSTAKAQHRYGDISDEKTRGKWYRVQATELKKLKDLPMPLEWSDFRALLSK